MVPPTDMKRFMLGDFFDDVKFVDTVVDTVVTQIPSPKFVNLAEKSRQKDLSDERT